MKLYGEFTKVEPQDDGTIIVHGIASSGAVDDAGETVLPDAMKAALPDYMKFGAVREMHGLSAAGTALKTSTGDDGATNIEALIVDPLAVKKVQMGVYKGFSIGGKVLGRDATDKTIITKLRLSEISLVDRPCNPEAAIGLWKADGAEGESMTEELTGPTNEEVRAEAARMAKTAGKDGAWKNYVTKARATLVAAAIAVEPVAKTDGAAEPDVEPVTEPAADEEMIEVVKAEAEAPADPVTALADALNKAKASAEAKAAEPDEQPPLVDVAKGLREFAAAFEANPLAKGLYTVAWLAQIIEQLVVIQADAAWETMCEGDNSEVATNLANLITGLGASLVAMATEEVAEQSEGMRTGEVVLVIPDEFAYAAKLSDLAKADESLMEKVGKRNSKADAANVQKAHDATAALGAMCDPSNCPEDAGKVAGLTTENERLVKALAEAAPAVEEITKAYDARLEALSKRLEEVAAQPAAPKTAAGSLRIVTKAEDVNPGNEQGATLTAEELKKYLADLPEEERGQLLLKVALRQPIAIPTAH